jgi:hypothetical protein
VKCSGRFKADLHPSKTSKVNEDNITANIIFNLAHLGISIEDTKTFDLNTYFEIVELEMNVISGKKSTKIATQSDIDKFLL